MKTLDEITAYGHDFISCTHTTTIEITKDNYLTKSGTCILGIKASKSCRELNDELKRYLKNESKIKVTIRSNSFKDSFYGYGHKNLTCLDEHDIVFRKSSYICDRTVLINCDKSSMDLKRALINNLKSNKKILTIEFEKI